MREEYTKYIKKRGEYYQIDYCHKGTRIRRSTGKTTLQEAIKVFIEFLKNLDNEPQVDKNNYTFDFVAIEFLKNKKITCRLATYKDYCNYVKCLFKFFSKRNIADINKELLTSYYEYRKINGTRDEAIKKELNILNIILNFAISYEYLDKNPVKDFILRKHLKSYQPRVRFLTIEEIKRILDNSNKYLKRLLIFLLETGLRIKEALNLTYDDICVDNKTKITYIVISKEISKSKKDRFVPLTVEAREQVSQQKIEFPNSYYVFTNEKGQGYTTTPRKALINTCKKARLNGIGFHIFRHTFASFKLQGINYKGEVIQPLRVEMISKLLGHSNTNITEEVYAKFSREDILKSLN